MGSDARRKEARKRKFGLQIDDTALDVDKLLEVTTDAADQQPAKKKKHKSSLAGLAENTSTVQEEDGKIDMTTSVQALDSENPSAKGQRFIVFIGNLPFTATENSIRKHFAKMQPKSIRHRTEKGNGKSKGFAFLEFEGYDRMKTCLKLYHHSSFEDGESSARRINVELTAGGGGKSKTRKTKLREKNEKLNEERRRRGEEAQREGKEMKRTEEGKASIPAATDNGDIHPSRRGQVEAR